MGSLKRIATAAATVLIALAFTHICAAAPQLKVNLVISSDSFMVYAGSPDGMKVGDKFTILRGESEIGTAEITRVETTYSIAKVVSKSSEIRDMDSLVSPSAAAASKASSAGTEKSAPAKSDVKAATDKKTDAKADTKAPAKPAAKTTAKPATKPAAKTSTSTAKKPEAKPAAKTTTSTAKKPAAEKTDDAAAEEASAAKAEEKKSAKPAVLLTDSAFASPYGPTGLFQMPTAEMTEKGKGSATVFRSKKNKSYSATIDDGSGALSVSESYSLENTAFAVSYGVHDRLEFSLAQVKESLTGTADASLLSGSSFSSISVNGSGSAKSTILSVKYNPQKKFLMSDTTSKKIKYALGLQRMSSSTSGSTGSSDATMIYGAASLPMKKMKAHGTIYYLNASGLSSGKRWGTMAGIEAPLTQNLSLISDMDLFRGEHTYTLGMRYYLRNGGAFSMGYYDLDADPSLMFTASFGY